MRLPHASTSTARLAALAGVAVASSLVGPVTAPADAARAKSSSLRIVSPAAGAKVSGATRLTAAAPRSARSVSFRVDAGRKRVARRRGHTRRDAGVLDTRALRPGRHTITLRGRIAGKLVTKRVKISVTNRRTLRAASGKGRDKPRKQTGVVPVTSEPTTTTTTPTISAPPAPSTGIFSDDFESGDFSRWDLFQVVSNDRITSVSGFGGRSGKVGRFEVRNGDHVNGELNSRSELGYQADMFEEGETHTFKWSTYFPTDYTVENGWSTTTQFKGEGTGGPPLELGVIGNEFMLNGGEHVGYAKLFSTDLARGQWLDFVVRVHWSRDPAKGTVDMWYRGQQVVSGYKMATLLPDRNNYFKIGHYRNAGIASTGVVFHDDVTITRG